jgi:hypothetical protein
VVEVGYAGPSPREKCIGEYIEGVFFLSGPGPKYSGPSFAFIHRSAWNMNSANFVITQFYEVRRSVSRVACGASQSG